MSSWSEMGGRDDTPRGHATYMGGISGTQSLLLIFLNIALRAPQFASPAGQWTSPPLTPTVPILPGALCFSHGLLGWGGVAKGDRGCEAGMGVEESLPPHSPSSLRPPRGRTRAGYG